MLTTHLEIGKKVRQTIKEIGGTMPENLPVEDNIKSIQKKLEKTGKKIIAGEKTSKKK